MLRDGSRFRLAIVDDREQLEKIVTYAIAQRFDLAVVDSVGEVLGLYGASANNDEDYTPINRAVMARLASSGACVISIDHLAKGHDSRAYGATGSVAKKRSIDGAMYRVDLVQPFARGKGGKARLHIVKDRPSGVREVSPQGEKSPEAATFELTSILTATDWKFWAPGKRDEPAKVGPLADVDVLAGLTPPPTSKRDVMDRLGWGSDRSATALRLWRSNSR